uniref:Uncharacterized protein n=1 Tax=Denticeps clupeoides TaxID=299321 RepID=A0AAY4EHP3_9TELE
PMGPCTYWSGEPSTAGQTGPSAPAAGTSHTHATYLQPGPVTSSFLSLRERVQALC